MKSSEFIELDGDVQVLTPIQHWFFAHEAKNYAHWNQLFRLKINEVLDMDLLKQVVTYITNYHDVFKLKFKANANADWEAFYKSNNNFSIHSYDLTGYTTVQQHKIILDTCEIAHRSLKLEEGPLATFLHFRLAKKDERIIIIVHHLIIDGVSWRILIEDINTAYHQLKNGQSISLYTKTMSYQYWAQQIIQSFNTTISKTSDYWLKLSKEPSYYLIEDNSCDENNYGSQTKVSINLTKQETQSLLTEIIQRYDVHINSLLLLPLFSSLHKQLHIKKLLINVEGHGRDGLPDMDAARTLGWFTTIYPVLLTVNILKSLREQILEIDNYLKNIPNNGFDYLALKYQQKNAEISSVLKTIKPDISFNYLGQFRESIFNKTIFSMADEDCGFPVAADTIRKHKIDLVAIVVNDELKIDWNYSSNLFKQETINSLANDYLVCLKNIISQN